MSHLLTEVSWLARAFYTSGSKKIVCSCLQDLDLLFEWHVNFSTSFIRTRQFSDAVKEQLAVSWDRRSRKNKQMFQNLYGGHKNS